MSSHHAKIFLFYYQWVEMVQEKVTFFQVHQKITPFFMIYIYICTKLVHAAIRFVLGDAYQILTKEERQALLHVCFLINLL
jgi:hypothetical protein